jgi:hypothetical protein
LRLNSLPLVREQGHQNSQIATAIAVVQDAAESTEAQRATPLKKMALRKITAKATIEKTACKVGARAPKTIVNTSNTPGLIAQRVSNQRLITKLATHAINKQTNEKLAESARIPTGPSGSDGKSCMQQISH